MCRDFGIESFFNANPPAVLRDPPSFPLLQECSSPQFNLNSSSKSSLSLYQSPTHEAPPPNPPFHPLNGSLHSPLNGPLNAPLVGPLNSYRRSSLQNHSLMRSEPNLHRRSSLDPVSLHHLSNPFCNDFFPQGDHTLSHSLGKLPFHSTSSTEGSTGLSHLHSSPHGSNTQLSRHNSNARLEASMHNSNSKLNSTHSSNSQLSHHGSNSHLSHHGSNPQLNHHGSSSQLSHHGSNSQLSHHGSNPQLVHHGSNPHLSHHGSNSHLSLHSSDSSLNGDGGGSGRLGGFPSFPTPEDIIKQTDRSKSLGNIFSCVQTQPLGQCYQREQPTHMGSQGGLNVLPPSGDQGPNGKGTSAMPGKQNKRKTLSSFGSGLGKSGIKKPR